VGCAGHLRLPGIRAGGLISYGPNLPELYRQSARLVDRILKGEKPAELPFEVPTRYELIINLKTAKTLGSMCRQNCSRWPTR
jgi:ABC-type uncharacterized transport system substrate-binding protein